MWPVVFPLVIYNGQDRWTATSSVAEMYGPIAPNLQRYLLQQHYFLVDIGHNDYVGYHDKDNITGLFFNRERAKPVDELKVAYDVMERRIRGPEYASLREILRQWLVVAILPRFGAQEDELARLTTFEEAGTMLEQTIEKWKNQWKTEWIQQGMQATQPEVWNAATEKATEMATERTAETIARKMLTLGLTNELIMQVTGLSDEKLPELVKRFVGETLAVAVYLVVAENHGKDVYLLLCERTAREAVYPVEYFLIHSSSFR